MPYLRRLWTRTTSSMKLAETFTRAERRAWLPPEPMTVSQWAERYRRLHRTQSRLAGPWRNSNAPYLAGIMDLAGRRGVEEVTIVKCAQAGGSEAVRNIIGYFAHQQPDPLLLVLPDENTGRKIVSRRLWPLFRETPCLRELITPKSRDVQLRHITLSNGFVLSLGWSGSPATLAADPCRVVVNDEVDKFPPWSGREADPISLARVRTQTYEGEKFIVNISTPTTREGLVWQCYESADTHLWYHVPCPHCGAWQRLAYDRLRWEHYEGDRTRQAAEIVRRRAAWYVCASCDKHIFEHHRPEMLRRGLWAPTPESIKDGVVDLHDVPMRHVGVHISALMVLWVPWHKTAAEAVLSADNPQRMQNFRNSWLGEVYEQRITRSPSHVFVRKAAESQCPPYTVPSWGQILVAAADVQADRIYYVIRAYGHGYRSQRIAHGVVNDWDSLEHLAFRRQYVSQAPGAPAISCAILGVDSGYRTDEVYRFCLRAPAYIKPLKGVVDGRGRPIRTLRITYSDPKNPTRGYAAGMTELYLHLLDTTHYKDMLSASIEADIGAIDPYTGEITEQVPLWALDSRVDEEYARQMSSETKVVIRTGRKLPVERWQLVTSGAQNHYWDCEVYCRALADMVRVDLLAPAAPPVSRETHKPIIDATKDGMPWLATDR